MAGINDNTVLMLHMNGDDESTIFTDSSPSVHSFTATGTAQIDTAIKKFGTGAGLFDGSSSCSVYASDSEDFDLGGGDFTIDFQFRPTTLSGTLAIISQWAGGGSGGSIYLIQQDATIKFYWNTGAGEVFVTSSMTLDINTWQHVCVMRSGNTLYFFKNGVQAGTGDMTGVTIQDSSLDFRISTYNGIDQAFSGNIDEVRIQKGEAYFSTAGFTPPSSEYTSIIEQLSENLEITDSISVIDTTILESETLQISDSISVIDTVVMESDNIQITDSILVTDTNTDAKFAYKILSINPLIFVTNTSPLEIIKVNTTDPINPTWEVKTVSGINSAKDVTINSDGTYIYIAGDAGQVIKVEVADLSNQTIIDLNDTDDVLTIEHNQAFGVTYAGTDNIVGELYLIDERSTFEIDSDFTCLAPNDFIMDSVFNIVAAFEMDSAFTALSYSYFNMASDFKCLSKQVVPIVTVNDITPIDLQDCHVYIDDVELEDTDVVLNSVTIVLSAGEESNATFQLTRKHDQLDTTLEGVGSVITNQNTVKITCKGKTLFPYNNVGTGRIAELDCQYQNDTEFVQVTAFAEEASNKVNNLTLSLPGLTSRLSLYDVLLHNPIIINPYVDPNNEDNPKKYKGIKVDLGTSIKQSVSRFYELDINGHIADKIQKGTFVPVPKHTYFWSPTATNIGAFANPEFKIGGKSGFGTVAAKRFFYIGSSLAPLSEGIWKLTQAIHWHQRVFADIESGDISLRITSPGYIVVEETTEPTQNPAGWKSGKAWGQEPSGGANTWNEGYKSYKTYYYVGSAPFQEISVRNGKKISKLKYKDNSDSLYSVIDESYDYTRYAKDVADLEYEKLKNINGDLLPDTSCVFGLTLDAFLYYDIGLLTKINVDNTTTANIYNKTHGFPVSAKSITITLSDRKVSIDADNTKSVAELEIINSQYPDEDSDEYIQPAKSVFLFPKTNMKTGLDYISDQEDEAQG